MWICCICRIEALSAGLSPSPRPVIRVCPARNDRSLHAQRIRFAHSGWSWVSAGEITIRTMAMNNSSLICRSSDFTIGRLNKQRHHRLINIKELVFCIGRLLSNVTGVCLKFMSQTFHVVGFGNSLSPLSLKGSDIQWPQFCRHTTKRCP